MNRTSLIILNLLALTNLVACSDGDSPIEPGVAVGIRAELVDDPTVVSEEIEIGLQYDLVAAARRTAGARVEAHELRSPNPRVVPREPQFERRKEELVDALSLPPQVHMAQTDGAKEAKLQPDSLKTFAGNIVCWTTLFESFGSLTKAESVSQILYYTGDGLYAAVAEATSLKLPTNLGFIGAGNAFGCAKSPDGATISVDYLESLLGIHFTYSAAFVGTGASVFYSADNGFSRAFQVVAGLEKASASFFPGFNYDLLLDWRSGFLVRPTLVHAEGNSAVTASLPNGEANPLKEIAARAANMGASQPQSYHEQMLKEHASLIAPTFAMASDTTGVEPEENLPAPTMADFFAHYIAQEEEYICHDCPNTSLDGIMAQMERDIAATDGEDGGAVRDAVLGGFLTYRNVTPDAQRFAASQRQSAAAVKYSTLAHEELAAELRGDANRYVSREIIELEGKVGESVVMEVDAQEIADLVGVEPAAVEGAQVTFDASPRFEASTFELQDGKVTVNFDADDVADLVFVVSVDLSSAAGPFPGDVADWTVRPALRRLRAQPGPVEHRFVLAAPKASPTTPVQLQAMLTDATGSRVADQKLVRFYDADDRLLGEALSSDGNAVITTTELRAVSPRLTDVEARTLLVNGEEAPGYALIGDGISRDAEIFVDGRPLDEAGGLSGYESSEEVLLYFEEGLPPGRYDVVVRNPFGRESGKVQLGVD
jgi:hypothetical protein